MIINFLLQPGKTRCSSIGRKALGTHTYRQTLGRSSALPASSWIVQPARRSAPPRSPTPLPLVRLLPLITVSLPVATGDVEAHPHEHDLERVHLHPVLVLLARLVHVLY